MVGLVLSGLTIAGLLVIGVAALVAPRMASTQYGIVLPDRRALAFTRAMGVRDLVIGVLLGLVLWTGSRAALAWGVAASALIAVVDYAVVRADPQGPESAGAAWGAGAPPRLVSLALHATGAVGLLLAALLLAAGF